jgi:hypothetical protein
MAVAIMNYARPGRGVKNRSLRMLLDQGIPLRGFCRIEDVQSSGLDSAAIAHVSLTWRLLVFDYSRSSSVILG